MDSARTASPLGGSAEAWADARPAAAPGPSPPASGSSGAGSAVGRLAAPGWLVALAVALVLYGLTLAPDLTWQDPGDYQVRAARLELVAPGDTVRVHPLYIVLAHALGRLGLWSYATAASLASALGAAVLAANLWLLGYLLTGRAFPATVGFLAGLLAHTLWRTGVQPQTYSWSNALLTGMVVLAVLHLRTGRPGWLLGVSVVGGLGLSVHVLSQIGLAVLGVWVLGRVLRRRAPWWVLPAGLGLWLLGGALHWYAVVLEAQRCGNLAAALSAGLVGRWGAAVFNTGGLGRMLARGGLFFVLNFPTPLALLGLWGVWRSRRVAGGAPAALLGVMLAVYVLFAARYRVPNQNHFFTPAYALFAVYIGLGVAAVRGSRRPWPAAVLVLLALAAVPMYGVMCRVARWRHVNVGGVSQERAIPYRDFYAYYLLPWQHGQRGPRRFAEEALARVPPRAVILPDTTTDAPLRYAHEIEGKRPDVTIGRGAEPAGEPATRLAAYRAQGRRVFVTSNHPDYVPDWVRRHGRLAPFGVLWEVQTPSRGAREAPRNAKDG